MATKHCRASLSLIFQLASPLGICCSANRCRKGVKTLLATACYFGVLLWGLAAGATEYHVAQSNGADGTDGSEAHPWATISACAKVAQAGDVCRVHAGTYRETVSPANSGRAGQPIRFEVADGECATVTGTEPLTASFTQDQGNIWVASVADTIEQLFSNGAMVWEGQWPNRTPGALFDAPRGVAAQGTGVQTVNGTSVTLLVDPNIPPGDWSGAMVYILPGSRWQSDSRPIKAYDAATHTITLDTTTPWAETSTQPVMSNQYYLYGSRLTLDAPDEWVWQNGSLYYYSTDNPATPGLEYKKRYYAFDINQSYVQIVGFHVFGSAVRLTGNHDTVDSLSIEYSSHLRSFNAYYTEGDVNRIVGNDNTWKNSLIEKSGSAGLIVAGDRNLIENNVVNDVVYQATNHAGLDMDNWTAAYRDNQFLYNTVSRTGRSGIFLYGLQNGRVLFNKVTDWALLTNDMGGIYAWGTDGEGTEIAYNELGGSQAFWSNGIYLDDKTKHFVVHHNYVHDSTFFGLCIKEENYYFNNTIARVGTPFLLSVNAQTGLWQNTTLAKVENNLTDGTLLVRVGILPTVSTDYNYFEGEVHPTPDWQHYNIAFTSLYQPGWLAQTPLDLSSISQIAFTPAANGDFEFDVDNIRLEGTTPLLLDDFESAGGVNGLGGYPWAGGSGDATPGLGTTVSMTFADGGPTSTSTKYAAVSGTMVNGPTAAGAYTWGLMNESVPKRDVSAYTGVSFDMRGQMKGFKVLAVEDNGPIQDHNANCIFSGTDVPVCAVEQGATIAGITESFTGSAPDIGAFELNVAPFVAGAQRVAGASQCGKIADITSSIPLQAPSPWSPVPDADAGVTDAGASSPDAGKGIITVGGGGCGCRTIGTATDASRTAGAMAILALAGILRRRRRGVQGCRRSEPVQPSLLKLRAVQSSQSAVHVTEHQSQ